jgi:ribosomal protein S8
MKYDKKISFAGNDATGIVIVDAQTGVMTDYKIADAPKNG